MIQRAPVTVHHCWWKFGHLRPRYIFVSRQDRAQVNNQLVEIPVSITGISETWDTYFCLGSSLGLAQIETVAAQPTITLTKSPRNTMCFTAATTLLSARIVVGSMEDRNMVKFLVRPKSDFDLTSLIRLDVTLAILSSTNLNHDTY